MKAERNNIWAAIGSLLHRVAAAGEGTSVIAVCSKAGEAAGFYHVCSEAGPDATPAIFRDAQCKTCVSARWSKCVCGFTTHLVPHSSAWWAAHRDHHLSVYPGLDVRTRLNFEMLIRLAAERELAQLSGVLQPPVGVS